MTIVLCKACKAEIVFLRTTMGRSIPVNAESVAAGDELFEQGKHVTHFATCPESSSFRRRDAGKS